jgi:glyoxylate utilization-related uncharacterized protein
MADTTATRNKGAAKAGNGKYGFMIAELDAIDAGTFNYVLQGTLKVEMDGQVFLAPAGTVVYVPPNMVHSMVATPEEDVIFYVVKDLAHGIVGIPADGKMSGAHYDPGFESE